jgi:amidohydrolase
MAEYDALPGIGHACGHNIIATSSVGAAIGIKRAGILEKNEGTVFLIGTPAEELGGAKRNMVEAGIFDEMDAALIIHPASMSTGFDISYAIKSYKIEFYGKSAHAAADPESGINALDAVISLFSSIGLWRQQLPEKVRVHGIISDGGQSYNTIPEYTSALIGLRALEMSYVDKMEETLNNIARAAALSTGCKFKVSQTSAMEEVYVNVPLAKLLDEKFEEVGEQTTMRTYEQGVGSTDVGSVTQRIPSIQGYIDITGREPVPTHTRAFAKAANSEYGYNAMLRAAKALALSCAELFENKELLSEVKTYFTDRRKDF